MKQLSILDIRIPDWGTKTLIDRDCPICNNHGESKFKRPDNLITKKCNRCGTFYISPAPDNDSLTWFYSTYHDNHSRMPKITPELLKLSYDKINPLADIRIRKLASFFNLKNTTILDIGFGQPFLLYMLQKLGAVTHGIDIDPKAIEYAKYLKIDNIFQGEIFDFNPLILYDAVLMTDFVEHPLRPMEYIQKGLSLLKIGGKLLIWTPNGNGEIMNEEPTTFRVDLEHMQYFTIQTILHIATELDLGILHLETLGQPALNIIKNGKDKGVMSLVFLIKKKVKRIIKQTIRKYILRGKFETNFFPPEIGSYHLFSILEKNKVEI